MRRCFGPAAAALLLGIGGACAGAPATAPETALRGEAFGTRWLVRLRGGDAPEPAAVRRAIETELEEVDRAMSNWRDDSELSRLNRTPAPSVPLSEPLAEVIETALRIHHDSGGALDITVAPLLRAFGFGPGDGDPAALPPVRRRSPGSGSGSAAVSSRSSGFPTAAPRCDGEPAGWKWISPPSPRATRWTGSRRR